MRIFVVLIATLALASACGASSDEAPTTTEELNVFLEVDVTSEQRDAVKARLLANRATASVVFVSKQEAFVEFQEMFADSPDMVESVALEDLPESFRITVKRGGSMEAVAGDVEDLPGVKEIVFPKEPVRGR